MGEGSAEGSAKGSAVGSAEGSAGGSNKWPLCEHANKIIKNKGCKQSSRSLPLTPSLSPSFSSTLQQRWATLWQH